MAHTLSVLCEMGIFNDELIREFVVAANSSAALQSAHSEADMFHAAQDLSLQLCQPPRCSLHNL